MEKLLYPWGLDLTRSQNIHETTYNFYITSKQNKNQHIISLQNNYFKIFKPGPEVITLFMLNSTEHEIYHAH